MTIEKGMSSDRGCVRCHKKVKTVYTGNMKIDALTLHETVCPICGHIEYVTNFKNTP